MAPTTLPEIDAEIATLTTRFNELRLAKQPLDEVKASLSELKKARAALLGAKEKKEKAKENKDKEKEADAAEEKKKERLLLKTAKGTRDYGPAESFCRQHIEKTLQSCFSLFGASCLDTPVFERKDILTDKYGEDAKLIFDLQDQGGEQLALRYDHTVPLARYLAMNGGQVPQGQHKIWQIGKVYRRDNPVMSKGRMREFMQADIDIVGTWDPMIPDAEILGFLSTALTRLDVGPFTIKLNHRKILDGIFEVCGVPTEKIRLISSAVDKLDKLPWDDVKKEMTEEKGLDPAVADKIGEYVKLKGGSELLERLQADAALSANKSASQGIKDMTILFGLLKAYGIMDTILFDMSLARGLDYYTGVIYEAIVEASAPPSMSVNPSVPPKTPLSALAPPLTPATPATPSTPFTPTSSTRRTFKKPKKSADPNEEPEIDESTVGVGSIAAGGRYDNLVSALTLSASGLTPGSKEANKLVANSSAPCIGVSIGMDRIFALVFPRWLAEHRRTKATKAFVLAAGDGLLDERVKLVMELRRGGIEADFLFKKKANLGVQFAAGERDEVPFAIILGEEEVKGGWVTVKEQKWVVKETEAGVKAKEKVESADKGVRVERAELVEWLKAQSLARDI